MPPPSQLLNLLNQDSCRVPRLREVLATELELGRLQAECVALLQVLDQDRVWKPLWLLRYSHERQALSPSQLAGICEALEESPAWNARLCACQLFASTGCPEALRDELYPYLVRALDDRRPITRAWALSALWTFHKDPRYKRSIRRFRLAATRETSKAVQARLKHLV